MKKSITLILALALAPVLLAGCSDDSGGGSTSSPTTASYAASDIKYFRNAGDLMYKNGSAQFTKTYDGFCAVAYASINNKIGPVLVGEDPVQVTYRQSSKARTYGSAGSIEVNNKKYYYSSAEGFVNGRFDEYFKYDCYVSSFTNLEDVARDVASKATFETIDPSKKIYIQYRERDVGGYEAYAGPYAQLLEDLVIPATYKGEDVTAVAEEGFKNLPKLKTVRFEGKKIKKIGKSAFNSNQSLQYVLIPDSVTDVGAWSFDVCSKDLLIFNERTETTNYGYEWFGKGSETERRAFWECKDYYVDGDYVYALKVDDEIAVIRYCGEDSNVVIPSEYNEKPVTTIEKFAFFERNRIVNVTFPDSLKYIRQQAFDSCIRLKKAVLPEGVKEIEKSAFNTCTTMEYAILPETVSSVGAWCFDNCDEIVIYCKGESGSFSRGYQWTGSSRVRPAYYKGQWALDEKGVPHPND